MINMQTAKEESGVFPRFYHRAVEIPAKSREAGRPIFVDQEYVEIRIAGDSKTVVNKKVTDAHKARWPAHYDAFVRGHKAVIDGTPIDEWSAISQAKRRELKAINIFTIEALADLSENGIQRYGMGGRALVEKAKAWLENSKNNAVSQKYAEENQMLRERIEHLENQVKSMLEAAEGQKNEQS